MSNIGAENERGGKRLTPARVLRASSRTEITFMEDFAARFGNQIQIAHDERTFLSGFTPIGKTAPPFTASVKGCVRSAEGVRESRQGVAMLPFNLVDEKGNYIKCLAFGRNADEMIITDDTEITIFGASARIGIAGESGALWLYDESYVWQFGSTTTYPPTRTSIPIGS